VGVGEREQQKRERKYYGKCHNGRDREDNELDHNGGEREREREREK